MTLESTTTCKWVTFLSRIPNQLCLTYKVRVSQLNVLEFHTYQLHARCSPHLVKLLLNVILLIFCEISTQPCENFEFKPFKSLEGCNSTLILWKHWSVSSSNICNIVELLSPITFYKVFNKPSTLHSLLFRF